LTRRNFGPAEKRKATNKTFFCLKGRRKCRELLCFVGKKFPIGEASKMVTVEEKNTNRTRPQVVSDFQLKLRETR
jgi:hypothetical protein